MAIERTIYFAHHVAFNIADTKIWMDELQDQLGDAFPEFRYESIYAFLTDMQFAYHVDGFLPDVNTGVMLPVDIWFTKWGVRMPRLEIIDDDTTVGTFSVTDSSFCLSDNSIIDEDLEFNDDDSTITLLSIELSDVGEHDWEIPASDTEE